MTSAQHSESVGFMIVSLAVTAALTVAGGTIAIFPGTAWKTEHRPSWPGIVLIFAASIWWGIFSALALSAGAILLSPIALPLPKTPRRIFGGVALGIGVLIIARICYHVYAS